MPYPAYLLNPGDMFQVDVDHVLFATGQKKGEGSLDFPPIAPAPADPADEPDAGDAEPVASAAAPAEPSVARTERLNAGDVLRRLKQLNERARGMVVGAAGRAYSAKKKRAFRALIQDIKKAISSAGRQKKASEKARKGEGEGEGEDWQEEDDDDISNPVPALTAQLQAITLGDPAQAATAEQQDGAQDGAAEAAAAAPESVDSLTDEERAWFERLEAEENENPHDPTKRYHTPWQPRPYMSAFAFVPRYLEVNPTICAAVYLRHPVARQGEAEVPTPFPFNVNQLAFNWYLRRR